MRRGFILTAVLVLTSSCATPPPPPAAETPAPILSQPEQRISQEPQIREFAFEGAIMQGGAVLGTAPTGTERLTLDGRAVPLDGDGRFLIAFDRDAGASARLIATLADGRNVTKLLNIVPRGWPIERVNAPLHPTKSSAEFEALRAPELAAINAARTIQTRAQGWRQRFAWPRIGRISGRFGSQRIYQGQPGSYHSGVDIAGATGDPVYAPADGVVILAADHPFTLEGNLLMLDHGMGLSSAFLHLSKIEVKAGQTIRRGEVIGRIGATGRASGPHLHWGMKWNDARIDPMLIAGAMPAS